MEIINSLSVFFYNIIPGFIFLWLNSLYFSDLKKLVFEPKDPVSGIFQVIVLSIFLGFVFQSLTKIIREMFFNKLVMDDIELKDKDLLKDAQKLLKDIPSAKKDKSINNIYLMHNYLITKYKVLLPEFFSPRLALWSNILFGSLTTIGLILLSPFFNVKLNGISGSIPLDIALLFMLSCYSWNMSKKYLYAFLDSVIRTFVSTRILNKEN
jgi:hypothetical protein